MTPATASLINAIALIALAGYGYLSSDTPSVTALIPVIFGVILLALNPGVRRGNKMIAHTAVVLTLIVLLGLVQALTGAVGREDTGAIVRVAIMIATTIFALVAFIRNFIAVRKARQG